MNCYRIEYSDDFGGVAIVAHVVASDPVTAISILANNKSISLKSVTRCINIANDIVTSEDIS